MQDLTPQLRTRLGRVERAVGVFVLLASLLLLTGFVYYVYHTAKRKGWFVSKATYWTSTYSAAGLKVGDPVKLWGFNVGEITRIDTLPSEDLFNVYVEFQIKAPYFGYLWTGGSRAKVTAADFLGNRCVEVTRGTNYIPTYLVWEINEHAPNAPELLAANLSAKMFAEVVRSPASGEKLAGPPDSPTAEVLKQIAGAGIPRVRLANKSVERKRITYVWDQRTDGYQPYHKANIYWLPPAESPALTERLEGLVNKIEGALPGVFNLTNQLAQVLSNVISLSGRADGLAEQAKPLVSNLTEITALLRDPDGSLGRWMMGTNMSAQLTTTLTNVNDVLTNASGTLAMANSNLVLFTARLYPPLQQLSLIVSNLNTQVQANTNFVSEVSSLVVHLDELIQGFKRHWLLRSAFREKPTNVPPRKPMISPKRW